MLRTISISSLLLLLFSLVNAQVKVVDVSAIHAHFPARYLPDVEGKVVVEESYFNYLSAISDREGIEVFPGWPLITSGSNERGGVYGNLDNDPELELVYSVGSILHAFNSDGSIVEGWPQSMDFPTDGAASFGDIDGDGIGEIVVTTHQVGTFAFGTIYAFETDGSDVAGFPVATEGGAVRTPTLADLDNNGTLEIIITVRDWPDGLVYVYSGNGSIYPGWPVRMDYVPGSAAAVGDIDGDEIPEIVTESYYGLHVFSPEGVLRPGFPYYPGLGRVFSYSSPVLADLDGDGYREIICGDHSIENGSGAVHIVSNTGTSWVDWPKITGSWVYGPPSVGDINGDGLLDIAVGDQTLSATPVNKVYAWTALTGASLPGFPVNEVSGINSQLLLADLDGDGMIELLADDNIVTDTKGKYPGFNHDGTIMEDFLLETNGSTFFINPMVLDINDDGILDISGGGTVSGNNQTHLYLWNSGVAYNSDLAALPILQYNTRHNGVYGDTLMVGVKEHGGAGAWGHGGMGAWGHGSVEIYPNPASSFITVSLSDPGAVLQSGDLQFIIYNSSGKECFSIFSSDRIITFNLESYPAGVYWLVIRSASGKEKYSKFLHLP